MDILQGADGAGTGQRISPLTHRDTRGARATLCLLAVVAALAALRATGAGWGPLSHHMGEHIVLMNAAAPVVAIFVLREWPRSRVAIGNGTSVLLATICQLVVLWAAHVPAVLVWSAAGAIERVAIQGALFAPALWFWLAVWAQRGAARWRALVALLVTGKLFCLLAALLVFSPRALYPDLVQATHHAYAEAIPDQQFAGLLMIAACPLTYVVAAVIISARMLGDLSRPGGETGSPGAD